MIPRFAVLHIFHGTGFSTAVVSKIGTHIFHYEDGRMHEFSIVYGRQVGNGWSYHDELEASGVRVAGDRLKEHAGCSLDPVRPYHLILNNSCAELEVASLNFVSALINGTLYLIAIMSEP